MTPFKYLVLIGLLAIGESVARAEDSSPGNASASPAADASAAGTPKSTHHRRHHHSGTAKTTTATGSTPPSAQTGAASTGTNQAGSAGTEKNATPETEPASNAASAAGEKKSGETGSSTGSHRHHHKGATKTADSAVSSTTPAEALNKKPAETITSGVPAPTAPTPPATTPEQTTVAGATDTAASTHHRRHHGKLPPIAVTPSAVPLPQQVVPTPSAPATVVGPTVETGLPVARPGAGTTASLPLGAAHGGTAVPVAKFPFADYSEPVSRRPTRTYPWKTNIITTKFWIGEGGSSLSSTTNIQSAWDMNWIRHNGGVDDPDEMTKRSGYSSLTHASTLNPFYIALPFNDLAYPEKAARWLPTGWYKPPRHGEKPVSACQNRWVEIKNRAGRVCYAQWEDVGPLVSDHAEYVFGPERPDTLTRAGLDVSPAVAKYLGFDSTALTSWRFVDDDDVQPGMWLRYDEQAILFQALEEQMHPKKTPRIQDLSEPVPDSSAQDDSEKRSGAARG